MPMVRIKHPIVALGLLVMSSAVQGAVFLVDRTDDDASASACTEAPLDCSLRGALDIANLSAGPDVVELPSGTFALTLNTNSNVSLVVLSEVSIRGSAMDETFIIAGSGFPGSAFTVGAGGALTLEFLTLSGFTPDTSRYPGGALNITGSLGANALLRSVRIENSSGRSGGGILVSRSSGGLQPAFRLQLFDSIITGNRSTENESGQGCNGGGLALLDGRIVIEGAVIIDNRTDSLATSGGGLCIVDAEASINMSTIAGNSASSFGAGIVPIRSDLTISETDIEDNVVLDDQSGFGAGLYLVDGNASILNSTLRNNEGASETSGAVLRVFDSDSFTLAESTISHRQGSQFGVAFSLTDLIEIIDVRFSGGGGRISAFGSTVRLERVDMFTFSSLDSAIRLLDSQLIASHLRVNGSRTGGVPQGGGIRAENSVVEVTNCEFSSHRAIADPTISGSGLGGAVYATASSLSLSQCSFFDNRATVNGGAIALREGSELTLSNSTLSDNLAQVGEALSITGISQAALENVTVANPNGADQIGVFLSSAIIGNSAIDGTCSLFSSGGDTESLGNVVTNSSCQVQNSSDLVVPDLLLHPLSENNSEYPSHLPRINSPLRDFAFGCPTEDQRGVSRGEPCDAGAVERTTADNNLFSNGFEN